MKKKLLALVTTLFMLFSFVGCSSEGTALMKEMQAVAEWEATEQTGSMEMDLAANEVTGKISLDYTAYTVTKDLKMEMTITPKSLEMNGATLDLTKGTYKLSPVKVYLDGAKMYMSSSYLKEVGALAGADVSEAMDLSKDFIAFDLTDTYKQMGMDIKEMAKESASLSAKFYEELGKADIKAPIKQEGRKYTIELSADDMVEAGLKLFAQSMEMQKDSLTAQYKALGLTDEQIKAAMAEMEALTSEETAKTAKEALKGSTTKVVLEYTDDSQVSDITLAAKVAVNGENIAFNFKMKDTAKKAAKKEVKMPTSVKVYTMDDFMKATAEAAAVEAAASDVTTDEAATNTQKDDQAATVDSTKAAQAETKTATK